MNKIFSIFSRYLLILLLGLGNLFIFYKIFNPLTFSLVTLFLTPFFSVIKLGSILTIGSFTSIELIPACIAGAAYYLLTALIFATPNIKPKRRILLLVFSLLLFLILNSLRIVLLIFLSNSTYFNQIHMLFWYLISTIFVVGIWFLDVKLFKIKSIPAYSDLREIYKHVSN